MGTPVFPVFIRDGSEGSISKFNDGNLKEYFFVKPFLDLCEIISDGLSSE
jgi:hypothetical protein